jgi:hypothetical protein
MLLHENTETHYYTTNIIKCHRLLLSGNYSGGAITFQALKPGKGSVDFVRYFNESTGAYGFSAAKGDEKFFTSRGYSVDRSAWSI